MSARQNGDMLTGRDGSDFMWSGGFQNVIFNYESPDFPSLRAEAYMDEINGGFVDAYNPNNAITGFGLGLGRSDILQFQNLALKYGTSALNSAGGNVTISLNNSSDYFLGDGSGNGILGDVCLFEYYGNKMFVIDGDGSGQAGGGDIMFDVDDSITSAKYDASLDAFTFA